jgi:hypothetical protein
MQNRSSETAELLSTLLGTNFTKTGKAVPPGHSHLSTGKPSNFAFILAFLYLITNDFQT